MVFKFFLLIPHLLKLVDNSREIMEELSAAIFPPSPFDRVVRGIPNHTATVNELPFLAVIRATAIHFPVIVETFDLAPAHQRVEMIFLLDLYLGINTETDLTKPTSSIWINSQLQTEPPRVQ